MGSYATLRVGDLEVASFKNGVDETVALVFTGDDWQTRARGPADADEEDATPVTELVAPITVVRDRLDITGAELQLAASVFHDIVVDHRRRLTDLAERIDDPDLRESIQREVDYLANFTLNDWIAALKGAAPDEDVFHPPAEVGTRRWLISLWEYADIRLLLRVMLECRDDDELVVIDVTDLIDGGWLSTDDDPREAALFQFGWAATFAGPIVVLTEGSTDAQILETALAVIYPHLVGFIRFADFTHQPEGNAAALVKTIKAFLAAGISNRVVALFDADTAARDAVRSLDLSRLPHSMCVLHLPPIELAAHYPTVGPTGVTPADINGKACSIELYLGRDVLTGRDGDLRPVRWTGYVAGVGEWQGVVDGTADILSGFRTKAKTAVENPATTASQDWSDLKSVLDHVRGAFDNAAVQT